MSGLSCTTLDGPQPSLPHSHTYSLPCCCCLLASLYSHLPPSRPPLSCCRRPTPLSAWPRSALTQRPVCPLRQPPTRHTYSSPAATWQPLAATDKAGHVTAPRGSQQPYRPSPVSTKLGQPLANLLQHRSVGTAAARTLVTGRPPPSLVAPSLHPRGRQASAPLTQKVADRRWPPLSLLLHACSPAPIVGPWSSDG